MGKFTKLLGKLSDHLPGQRVFFIYTHHNSHDRFQCGMKANTEISYWSMKALKDNFPRVTFLRLEGEKPEKIERIKSQDVVIGHVGETYLKAAARTKRVVAFYPWAGHEDRSNNTLFNCLSLEKERAYLNAASSIIWLTSEYNVKHYVLEKRNFWFEEIHSLKNKKRLNFVHQPIDLTFFKRVKFNYDSSNFVYIGNDAHMKGLNEGLLLTSKFGKNLALYGVGERRFDHLSASNVSKLVHEADFFLQPGMWEAQCVSILEAAARGFIPIVTPETGYPYSHPFLLKFGDQTHNEKIIQSLLHTTAQERKVLADHLHTQLTNDQNHNHWKKLTDVLVQEVGLLYNH